MATINVLLTSFPGSNLPQTLCLPVPRDISLANLRNLIGSLLPQQAALFTFLTTSTGWRLPSSADSLESILQRSIEHDETPSLFSLRLSAPLRGGKGGFGSQLRAAGGRMSSRKKKQNAELAMGSARNLDGRRLRTITEAKNLATYLATKPDMDRKENEERKKRWQAVVDMAEQREADMRAGKTVDGRRKGLSSEWLEEKDEIGENVKNAVKLAINAANQDTGKADSSGSGVSATNSADEESDAEEPMELDQADMNRLRVEAESGDADAIWVLQNKLKIPQILLPKPKTKAPRFAGFDDEFSDTDSEDNIQSESKDKQKASSLAAD